MTEVMQGIRILEVAEHTFVPAAAAILADWGADVIKIEHVERGDAMRGLASTGVVDLGAGKVHALLEHSNRGKRSLALDLKAPAGREIASSLAARADVVIEGFRPGVAARLGLGYDELRTCNPGLLYVSVSGFGQEGPCAALPCTDSVAQAFSGLMSVNLGNDGTPHRVGAIIVDTLTCLYAAQALGVALFMRASGAVRDSGSRSVLRSARQRS